MAAPPNKPSGADKDSVKSEPMRDSFSPERRSAFSVAAKVFSSKITPSLTFSATALDAIFF
jgi:hypothetical protein